jgi:hypothetical protein|tara:strand:+ start:363 stop:560 length:198 start_codon:yes stop_codon:yes gene_type:complete
MKYRKGKKITAEEAFRAYRKKRYIYYENALVNTVNLGQFWVKTLMMAQKQGKLFEALEERREKES